MDLFLKARDLGIQTEFIDGQGRPHVTAADALKVIFDALPPQAARALIDGPVVTRQGQAAHSMLLRGARFPVRWEIRDEAHVVAGETPGGAIAWPRDLPLGVYRLRLTDAAGTTDEAPLVSAPATAFAGDFDRGWLLAVQLYGVRSTRNWGMGDFTDLADLIDLAHQLGADGIGLNPLHALFDDKPGDCSPYSPNSRLFLNALYIDAEALPEFSAAAVPDVAELTPRLRQSDEVDYVAVAGLKWQALRAAFAAFKVGAGAERKADFEKFRSEQGALLAHFACFEMLRHKFKKPWWEWPEEWRDPDEAALARLRSGADAERNRIRRIRAMECRPPARRLQGARRHPRHEGRALSRCRRRRAVRRVRCLERAGRDFAAARRRRSAGSAGARRPGLGARRLQRHRSRAAGF